MLHHESLIFMLMFLTFAEPETFLLRRYLLGNINFGTIQAVGNPIYPSLFRPSSHNLQLAGPPIPISIPPFRYFIIPLFKSRPPACCPCNQIDRNLCTKFTLQLPRRCSSYSSVPCKCKWGVPAKSFALVGSLHLLVGVHRP